MSVYIGPSPKEREKEERKDKDLSDKSLDSSKCDIIFQ